jgi:hypothetical protein
MLDSVATATRTQCGRTYRTTTRRTPRSIDGLADRTSSLVDDLFTTGVHPKTCYYPFVLVFDVGVDEMKKHSTLMTVEWLEDSQPVTEYVNQ